MSTRLGVIFLTLAVAGCGGARTGSADAITIEGVLVGFPTSPRMHGEFSPTDGSFKRGSWTPVYVNLACDRNYEGPASIVVESGDNDEVPVRYVVPLPQLSVGQRERFVVYTHPGGRYTSPGSVSVDVVAGEAATVSQTGGTLTLLAKTAKPNVSGFGASRVLYLALGSSLDAAPLRGLPAPGEEPTHSQESRSVLAIAMRADDLPNVWFGYDAVDLAILASSQRDQSSLLAKLSEDRTGRKEALAEWVRRGGRLLVCAGRNVDLLAGSPELAEMLPVNLNGSSEVDVQRVAWKNGGAAGDEPIGKVSLARMTPRADRDAAVLAAARSGASAPELPLVVRGSYGLGRVTVVAMDIDEQPVVGWKSYGLFVPELAQRAGPFVPSVPRDPNAGYVSRSDEDNLYSDFFRGIDTFPGVPVISFGWVALFILIYIIIVGPLDYLFLKKVVKRLELTWITFPTIVLLVSVGAYYAAYALKGSDLRINKYDLVDVDVAGKRAYGQTWFSLFSPRIQNYEIGVEPADSWVSSDPSETLVNWSGPARSARGSLFPRPYYYAGRATGLHGVPVQVWSTKAFQSSWVGRFDPDRPLVVSNLRHPPSGSGVIGQVTLNLPVPLENAFLVTGGEAEPTVRPLGTIAPGIPKAVSASEPRAFADWVDNPFRIQLRRDDINAEAPTISGGTWEQLRWFFHDRRGGPTVQNAGLRRFDQSWRISRDSVADAILVGTLPTREGPSEEITADPAAPSRLWLGALPRQQPVRPALEGRLKQETCVRIFLRVAQSDSR